MNIILCGATGKMGQAVQERAADLGHAIVAGTARTLADRGVAFPLYATLRDVDIAADVAICFAPAPSVTDVLAFCLRERLPLVCGSTGLSHEQVQALHALQDAVPVFYSANLSCFVHAIEAFLSTADLPFGAMRSVTIREVHHTGKRDAPSGTAVQLERLLRERSDRMPLSVESERIETTRSEHTIEFVGEHERMSLRHVCESREAYAINAIRAAEYIRTKPCGLYAMRDLFDGGEGAHA